MNKFLTRKAMPSSLIISVILSVASPLSVARATEFTASWDQVTMTNGWSTTVAGNGALNLLDSSGTLVATSDARSITDQNTLISSFVQTHPDACGNCQAASSSNGQVIYVRLEDGSMFVSKNAGGAWTPLRSFLGRGVAEPATIATSQDGSSIAVSSYIDYAEGEDYGWHIYFSNDFGVSASYISGGLKETNPGFLQNWKALLLTNNAELFAANADGGGNLTYIYKATISRAQVHVTTPPDNSFARVASIPSGITTATIPATPSLPATTLNFGGTVPTSVTVAPVTTNPASAASTPFTISGLTKIVDIQISGTFTGSATVCLDGAETDHLFHYTGGAWVELPSRSYVGGQVCGVTTSFSPFAAAPPAAVSLVASNDAAAKAAAEAAAAKREAEKQAARADIISKLKNSKELTVDSFIKAEIPGITASNIAAAQAEILALPEESRTDINQVLKVAHKYEVVGNIGSDRVSYLQSNSFVEIGLIPASSKNKVALVAAVKMLPASARDTYAEIKAAIDAATASIQARKDRLAATISRNTSRYSK